MPTFHTLRYAPLAVLLLAGAAQAAPDGTARERYLQDRQACMSGNTWQARDTCLREAGAALQAARRGNLTSSEAERLDNNALQRCSRATRATPPAWPACATPAAARCPKAGCCARARSPRSRPSRSSAAGHQASCRRMASMTAR